jgi:hypothetical protein
MNIDKIIDLIVEKWSLDKKDVSEKLEGLLPKSSKYHKNYKLRPKPPLSAYMYFSIENRKNLGTSFGNSSREIGARWKELQDKEKYEQLAKNDSKRYLKELNELKNFE